MILQNKTIVKNGYDPSELTMGSRRKVYIRCDECGLEFERIAGEALKQARHTCRKCACEKRAKSPRRHKQQPVKMFHRNMLHATIEGEGDLFKMSPLSEHPCRVCGGPTKNCDFGFCEKPECQKIAILYHERKSRGANLPWHPNRRPQ